MTGMIGTIVDFAWKGTAVFAAAGMAALCLRRASASARHVVWTASLASALAVPFMSRALPQWKLPVWNPESTATVSFYVDAMPSVVDMKQSGPASTATGRDLSRGTAQVTRHGGWIPVVVLLWFAGAALMLLRMAIGRVALRVLRRKSAPASQSVQALASDLAFRLGITPPIEVLTTCSGVIPVTWGVLRPVILVPRSLLSDLSALRVTLIHELAHIIRRDYLWQALTDAACTLYWFHPLAWFARRAALRLREKACDDIVLGAGARPSDYAAQLLRFARTLSCPRLSGVPAISRCGQLESRLRAILDPRACRNVLSRRAAMALVGGTACVALVIAPVRPASASVAHTTDTTSAPGFAANDYDATDAHGAEAIKAFDFQRAVLLYQESLQARSRSGTASVEYAEGLANLVHAHLAWGHLGDAATYAAQALPLLERHLGANARALFEPLYVLGVNERATNGAHAEDFYERALAVTRSSDVPGCTAALAWNALAMLKAKRHDISGALGALDQALAPLTDEDCRMKTVLLRNRAAALRESGQADQAAVDEATLRDLETSAAQRQKSTTAQQASVEGVYRVGDGIVAPVPVKRPEPVYSSEARVQHVEGTVVLSVVIGGDGSIGNVRILRSLGFGLDNEAMEAVRRWKFEPGKKQGEPVAVLATVEVNFRLM